MGPLQWCWLYTCFASMKQPVQHCSYVSTQTEAEGFNLSLRPSAKPAGSPRRAFGQAAPQGATRIMHNQRPTKKKSPSDLRRDLQRCRQKPGASVNAPRSPGASDNAPRVTRSQILRPWSNTQLYGPGCLDGPKISDWLASQKGEIMKYF